jgi:predicted nucleic-acid-binding protein
VIGLDTNILIRYLTQDDPSQSALANEIIETQLSEKFLGFISLAVLLEIVWVMKLSYGQPKEKLLIIIEGLLATKQFSVERADLVYLALKRYRVGSADFSDALIFVTAIDAGCEKVLSFDKKARTVGMDLLS